MKILLRTFATFLLFAAASNPTLAQQNNQKHVLRLGAGEIALAPNVANWADSASRLTQQDPVLVFIHFSKLPDAAEKEKLRQSGITLLDYLPDNTYAAHVMHLSAEGLSSVSSLYSITTTKPEWKTSDYIWQSVAATTGPARLLVSCFSDVPVAKIKSLIAQMGGQVEPSPMEIYHAFKVTIAASQVHALASWYGVNSISPGSDMVPYDLLSRPAVVGNQAVASPIHGGYGLTGNGVTVGVGDNCSGIYHADLKDRIVNFNPVGVGTHGAHVNGIVGGAGIIDELGVGMATKTNLIDFLFDQIIPSTAAMYHDYNMTITNNSYGVVLGTCTYSGTYDGYSNFLDTVSIQNPKVLHVFASGNDGWMHCTPMPAGFGTVGGGYQPAKNNVVVGSITDFLLQAPDQSRGPTRDGRIKPEIVAVGLGAYSTVKRDEYGWAAGTSMAAPQVAGGLSLLTERYKQIYGGTSPRADLLKAILLNGATDIGNKGPDFTYGFGSLDVQRSLVILDSAWYTANTLFHGDSQTVSITVPPNTAQLKVLLTWQDMPASPMSSKQLVNDLDLSVHTPSSVKHFPLVPDPAPTKVNDLATEKVDHTNTTEQVVIDNPAAGTYTISVKGFQIPSFGQAYVLAYEMLPKGIALTYPVGGEDIVNVDTSNRFDSLRIFWRASESTNKFTLQFSNDDGANWTTVASDIPADQRYYPYRLFGNSTDKCRMKLTRNGTSEVSQSGRFVMNTAPVISLDTAQCPGYISTHWNRVTNAAAYIMLAKVGAQMAEVDTVTDTNYTFKNMSLTERSYVAVRPLINGLPGVRSVAAITTADKGNCNNAITRGDIGIDKIKAPLSGRLFTRSQLRTNETLSVLVRNHYNIPATSYNLSYSINGGAWIATSPTTPIPAHGTATVNIIGLDLHDTGTYWIRVVIHNDGLSDPRHANDSITYVVKQMPNDTLTLPFTDDFETMPVISIAAKDSVGISPNSHWDFHTNDSAGRIRSFVNKDITIGGERSMSMDENQVVNAGGFNSLVGTFNLSGYDTANSEVRFDIDYMLHGSPKSGDGNVIMVRPNDGAAWQPVYNYDLSEYAGYLRKVKSVSLTDAARYYSNNFSSSYQVSIGQNDTSLIAATNFGNGMTFDNMKLYTVANDFQLVSVVSPLPANCGLTGNQPVIVRVRNGVNYTLRNIQMHCRVGPSTVFNQVLDSLLPKATVDFRFTQDITIPKDTTLKLSIWGNVAGDTYPENDSMLNYEYRNNTIIDTYPFLEDFENGKGGFYTSGISNSWQYGTPASTKVKRAASGTKAWKTNLTGRYNNLELSYLYSPCFDLSALRSPMLSFSAAMDIENCGVTMCDRGYIDYTTDGGKTWAKLGKTGQGTNWYDSTFGVWNTHDFTRWHVCSMPLLAGNHVVSFRFVLATDPGVTLDGLAIDDIHVFDKDAGIFPSTSTEVKVDLSGTTWTTLANSGNIVAAVQPFGHSAAGVSIKLHGHESVSNPSATQYVFARNYSMTTPNPGDSIGLRLYILEQDIVAALSDTTCPSCTPVKDAYTLGITHYRDRNSQSVENGTLADNVEGVYSFFPFNKMKWVPQDNGYYAEAKLPAGGEYWFNNGGPTGNIPAGSDYVNFAAYKKGNDAQLYWRSMIDTSVDFYRLERSSDSVTFSAVLTTSSRKQTGTIAYSHTDSDVFPGVSPAYYRLRWTMSGSTDTFTSPVRKLLSTDDEITQLNFTAAMIASGKVQAAWSSNIDAITNHYQLERAIEGREFRQIDSVPAARHFGQAYSYLDVPTGVAAGTLIRYRLTAFLDDGTSIVLPEQVVEWAEQNMVASVYPNPSADGSLNIVWYALPGTKMEINLTDNSGKSTYSYTARADHWRNVVLLQTPYKPKGVYLLQCVIGGKKSAQKVVFE